MNGIVVLDKPAGITSFGAVARVRKLTGEKKIGHTGTLDPMATGVLPLLLGRAAKAAELIEDTDKDYSAEFEFGKKTDTGDITGQITYRDENPVAERTLLAALEVFRGKIYQIPPMYSAMSVNGQRLYKLARQGIEIERGKRPVEIYSLILTEYDEERRSGTLFVSCSKGTYIRTLIEDIAEKCGTSGVMTALRRTKACGFEISRAVTLEHLAQAAEEGRLSEEIEPVEQLFEQYAAVTATQAQMVRFSNGGALSSDRLKMPRMTLTDGMRFRVYSQSGAFLGLGEMDIKAREIRVLKLLCDI